MRKRIAWALGMVMTVGIGASAVLADDDPPPTPKATTTGFVGPLKDWNKPAPKPAPKKKDEPPAPPKPTIAEKVQAARYKEQADLLRRMAVCDKLKEIAENTHDADLLRKAEQLQERANNIYTDNAVMLAKTLESSHAGSSVAVADSKKLLEKKDAAAAVAAKGDKP